MSQQERIAQLGAIMQLAFVVPDLESAIGYWASLGAGPFFIIPEAKVAQARYRGEPSQASFALAIGYWHEMQIELVRQTNDAPSIYLANAQADDRTLHHVAVHVADMGETYRVTEAAGGQLLYDGLAMPNGEAFAYFKVPGLAGAPIIEYIQTSDAMNGFFAMLRQAAKDWDGADPILRL